MSTSAVFGKRSLIISIVLASSFATSPLMAHDYRNTNAPGYNYPPPNMYYGPAMNNDRWTYPSPPFAHRNDDQTLFSPMNLARKLDLSDTQQRRIETILDDAFEHFRDIGEEMSDNRRKIRRLIRAGKNVDQLAEAQGILLTKMIKQRADLSQKIAAELDDKQRTRFLRSRGLRGYYGRY